MTSSIARTRLVLILATALLAVPRAVVAQAAAPPAIHAASPEVFQAIKAIYAYNSRASLQADTLTRQEFPAYTRQKVVFSGQGLTRVPGYLLLPKAGKPPFPVVILLHGITGSKEGWFEPEGWAYGTRLIDPLIAAGDAVMALDARYHGERGAESGYRISFDLNDIRDLIVTTVIEHRRAMDYLATRAELDTARIGVLGLSMGGLETFALTAVDPRVKVAVAGVTPVGGVRDFTTVPVAPQTFAGAIKDTPILMLMGRSDEYYTVEEARQLFASIASPRKELVFYEGGHRMPPEYAAKAVGWLLDGLRLR
jgi:dienelactone hydrolase